MKLHLLTQLSQVTELRIVERCKSDLCWSEGERARLFVEGWDQVIPEMKLESLRPDLLLLKAGRPLAAIEVHSTHAVSPEKAHTLSEMGLPWIEVSALEIPYSGEFPWTADEPLPVECVQPGAQWKCSSCKKERYYQEEEERRYKKLQDREARMHAVASRVYDAYGQGGRRFREILHLEKEVVDGRDIALRIRRGRRGDTLIDIPIRGGNREAARRIAEAKVDRWEKYLQTKGWRIDKPHRWVVCDATKQSHQVWTKPRYVWTRSKEWRPTAPEVPPLQPEFHRAARIFVQRSETASSSPQPVQLPRGATVITPSPPVEREQDTVRFSSRLIDRYRPKSLRVDRRALTRQIWRNHNYVEGNLTWYPDPQPFVAVCSPTEDECTATLDDAFEAVMAVESWNGTLVDYRTPWGEDAFGTLRLPWGLSERVVLGVNGRWTPLMED